jgi:hypothetical protein
LAGVGIRVEAKNTQTHLPTLLQSIPVVPGEGTLLPWWPLLHCLPLHLVGVYAQVKILGKDKVFEFFELSFFSLSLCLSQI